MQFQLFHLVALAGFLFSCAVTIFLTGWIRKQAMDRGAVDLPNARSLHRDPIPRLGGLAIAMGFYFGLFFFQVVEIHFPQFEFFIQLPSYPVLLGSFIMLLTGVFDDIKGVTPKQKLGLQSVAAVVLILGGFQFDFASYIEFRFGIDVQWIDYPITFIWIIGVINAFNLIDGMDGLAAGTAAIVMVSMTFAIALAGYGADIVFIVCFLGPLLGFLVYNRPPASIFMGDSGSLFLGVLLATFALPVTENVKLQASFLIPILALGLPILDTLVSIYRRTRKGQHPFQADRDHIHHRIFRRAGWSPRRALYEMYAISILFGVFSIVMATADRLSTLLVALVLLVLLCAILLYRLGYFDKPGFTRFPFKDVSPEEPPTTEARDSD